MRYFKSVADFYTSDDWANFRKCLISERMTQDMNTVDELTGLPIYDKKDIVLHHKIFLNEENVNDVNISLNPENIIIVSRETHNRIHNRFGYNQRKVDIIWGPPCSGKLEYAKKHASDRSLILSLDNLYNALTVNPMYVNTQSIKPIVFDIRDVILEAVKYKKGDWDHAFLVTSTQFYSDIERMKSTLGASVIVMNSSKEQCLAEAHRRPSCFEKYVNNWFEKVGDLYGKERKKQVHSEANEEQS